MAVFSKLAVVGAVCTTTAFAMTEVATGPMGQHPSTFQPVKTGIRELTSKQKAFAKAGYTEEQVPAEVTARLAGMKIREAMDAAASTSASAGPSVTEASPKMDSIPEEFGEADMEAMMKEMMKGLGLEEGSAMMDTLEGLFKNAKEVEAAKKSGNEESVKELQHQMIDNAKNGINAVLNEMPPAEKAKAEGMMPGMGDIFGNLHNFVGAKTPEEQEIAMKAVSKSMLNMFEASMDEFMGEMQSSFAKEAAEVEQKAAETTDEEEKERLLAEAKVLENLSKEQVKMGKMVHDSFEAQKAKLDMTPEELEEAQKEEMKEFMEMLEKMVPEIKKTALTTGSLETAMKGSLETAVEQVKTAGFLKSRRSTSAGASTSAATTRASTTM